MACSRKKIGGRYVRLALKLSSERMKGHELGRVLQPEDVWPGKRVNMDVHFKAPDQPGSYILKLDLAAKRIVWFERAGGEPITVEIVVQ